MLKLYLILFDFTSAFHIIKSNYKHNYQYKNKNTRSINSINKSVQRSNTKTVLAMSSIIPTIISGISVAGVIAFHEAGHFFAAKWQGMKIQSYNIGNIHH